MTIFSPIIVKADTDALAIYGVHGYHFVAKPALEECHSAGFCRVGHMDSIGRRRVGCPGWRCHEAAEAGDLRTSIQRNRGRGHVIRPADDGVGMQVEAVHRAPGHDVHPAINPSFEVHVPQIPVECLA